MEPSPKTTTITATTKNQPNKKRLLPAVDYK